MNYNWIPVSARFKERNTTAVDGAGLKGHAKIH